MSYNPRQYLSQIKCPILALNGEKDIQVTPDNLHAIKEFAKQSDVTTITIEKVNHLFQKCYTCNISEYGMLTETFSNNTLKTITMWMSDNGFIEK